MARIKYYNKQTGQWEYADNVLMSGSTSAVEYVEQKLTEEQKEQARENIGAISATAKDNIDMNGFKITNLPLPTTGSEPATKEFVENFTVEGSTYVATDDNKDGNIVIRPYVADADELEFKNHIKNNNNPHGVTSIQIGAAPMSYVKKVGNPHNLLDNSDFRNPVNQRGQLSYGGTNSYCIDRWILQYSTCLYINDGYVTLTDLYDIRQKNSFPIKKGTRYTFAARIRAVNAPQNIQIGSIDHLHDVTLQHTEWQTVILPEIPENDYGVGEASAAFIGLAASNGSVQLEWVALYEGEYTAETLPEYQPKGYAAELMECMRYFWRFPNATAHAYTIFGMGTASGARSTSCYLRYPVPMRLLSPTVTASGSFRVVDSTWTNVIGATKVEYIAEALNIGNSCVSLSVTTATDIVPGGVYHLQAANDTTAHIDISADL